jgi:hypothetical protein
LQKRMKELQDQANQANLDRYNQGRALLGLEDPDAWRQAGFGDRTSYQAHQARLAQESAANRAGSMGGVGGGFSGGGFGGGGFSGTAAGVGAAGGNITPQALASRVQAKQRGIYNSSTALNQEAVTNSLALADSARADQARQFQLEQFAESQRRADQSAADQLRGEQLDWLYKRNDIQPDLDRLKELAATEGEGTTEGMSYPVAPAGLGGGGGAIGGSAYGGAGQSGYLFPYLSPYDAARPRPPKNPRKEANRQSAYERIRIGKKLGVNPDSIMPQFDVPPRDLGWGAGQA